MSPSAFLRRDHRRPRLHRRGVTSVVLFQTMVFALAAVSLVGCAGPGPSTGTPDEPDQPAMNMWLLDADGTAKRYALYKWDSDGTFRFGGGQAALEYQTPVRLTFTSEARSSLASAMKSAGWFQKSFEPSAGSGPRELEVDLRLDGTHRKFTVMADGRTFDAETQAVLDVLQSISAQQFRGVLDALPAADQPAR
ncbi:MAG: hypothetical protein P8J59_09320 [Phycisphaerales bacterium]|nr:hypothetical protein [Phycisphaerales bacterium]